MRQDPSPVREGARALAPLVAEQGGTAGVAIFAAATGLATAVPVPGLDRLLSGLVRGAALRRVAARRGVRLTRAAREVLAAPQEPGRRASLPMRVTRAAIERLVAPFRVAARVDDALSVVAASLLLDHHLSRADRPAHAPLTVTEARRVRAAMESAEVGAALDAMRSAPAALVRAVVAATRAAVALDDTEDRSPMERATDHLLDALADAPSEVRGRLRSAFDRALGLDAAGVQP